MAKSVRNPKEILRAYLAENGMKLTNQRRLIAQEFFQPGGHWTADELYQKVRMDDPSIGMATVYRTLKLLRAAKLARELNFSNDVTVFEPILGTNEHDHLICEKCGKTLAVKDERIEALHAVLTSKSGFEPTSHRMYLYGICPDCKDGPSKSD